MSTQVQLVFAAKRRAKPGAEHALAAARDWAQAERVVAACGAHSQLHRVYVHALARHCDAQRGCSTFFCCCGAWGFDMRVPIPGYMRIGSSICAWTCATQAEPA